MAKVRRYSYFFIFFKKRKKGHNSVQDALTQCRRFKKWLEETGETDAEWFATSRFMACVAVYKRELDAIFAGPPPSRFDDNGEGFVTLISLDKKERDVSVGLSYLVPRVYVLLQECGWDNFRVGSLDVACP